jgi:hypothetical protein
MLSWHSTLSQRQCTSYHGEHGKKMWSREWWWVSGRRYLRWPECERCLPLTAWNIWWGGERIVRNNIEMGSSQWDETYFKSCRYNREMSTSPFWLYTKNALIIVEMRSKRTALPQPRLASPLNCDVHPDSAFVSFCLWHSWIEQGERSWVKLIKKHGLEEKQVWVDKAQ